MATNNAHVFISYSRRNIDFAKLLFRELNKSKRDVWVDWEDIPRGADWLQEIYSGIDNADTFIFLVSEHSLASEICNRELAYALQHNKKIIPLILQEINEDVHQRVATKWQSTDWNRTAQSNWNALKHINWIFFNNPAKYNSEFQALLNTVDQDLFHIKTHTRLLVRAQEWHNAERNPSSLLQGDDLISAEFWLKTYAEADPIPTQLHKEFIQASREQENDNLAYEKRLQNQAKNRLQILVGSFAVLLGVIVFALLPLINTQLEFRLADDIDFRLSEAALSFRDLLDDDEELALVSALFVANVDLVRELADDNVSAEEFEREIAPIRDDFDLQEVSFFWASFDYGTEPVYFIRPEINHNERVQQLREDLVLDALEFEDDVSDIVIGSPESQIIAAAPVYRTDSDDLIGAVLVAYHINDEYISEIADILDIEAIIANIENQIVVTTISTPPEIADSIRPYLEGDLDYEYTDTYGNLYGIYEDYDQEDADFELSFADFVTGENEEELRMVATPLILGEGQDAFQEGTLFVASSFDSVNALQDTIQMIIFAFAGVIGIVVLVLLVFLAGIPYLRNRSPEE